MAAPIDNAKEISSTLNYKTIRLDNDILVEEEMSWQRGCKIMVNQTIGCSQHKWFHDGKELTVDECICNNNLWSSLLFQLLCNQ